MNKIPNVLKEKDAFLPFEEYIKKCEKEYEKENNVSLTTLSPKIKEEIRKDMVRKYSKEMNKISRIMRQINFLKIFKKTGYNISRACRKSGISRRTFLKWRDNLFSKIFLLLRHHMN